MLVFSKIMQAFKLGSLLSKSFVVSFTSLSLMGMVLTTNAQANPQEAEFLRKVAEQYILAQFTNLDDNVKIEVEASRLDDRRDYGGKCEGYLTAQLKGSEIRSNSQVIITCSRPQNPYQIVLPVKVKRLTRALVASRNLSRGAIITQQDLSSIYLDENTNLTTAVSDPNILVGSRLKRDVKAGDQIRSNSFCVVCKNDKISIIAKSHALQLKTAGIALDDGTINDTIRIKNLKSGKVISGVVIGPAQVKVIF